jgi:hypothetical protein
MPGFDLSFPTGSSVTDWVDTDGTTDPCRLNPRHGQHLKRRTTTVGIPVAIQCLVDGELLTDAELTDGNLFHWSSHEAPHPDPAVFDITAGTSAEAMFTPRQAGHYLLSVRRQGCGRWFFHVDAEEGD